ALSSMAGAVNRELTHACADLADDLLDYCVEDVPNLKAEVSAVLWSLGFAAEAFTVRSAPCRPNRRLLRQVVRQSVRVIAYDSLLQYIWLEMKKSTTSFDIRQHRILFALFNRRYPEPYGHNMSPESPARTYA